MTTVPLVYHYDDVSGILLGSTPAHASPLEPGVYLTPANATMIAPPAIPAGQVAVFANDAWTLETAPVAPAEAAANTTPNADEQIRVLEQKQARPLRELAIAQANNDTAGVAAAITRIKGFETQIEALRATMTAPAVPAAAVIAQPASTASASTTTQSSTSGSATASISIPASEPTARTA